jgi:metal-responsive CopG/Arc/MetJ family transcriptional regulator
MSISDEKRMISVVVDERVLAEIDERAERMGMTRSRYVSVLLEMAVDDPLNRMAERIGAFLGRMAIRRKKEREAGRKGVEGDR